MGIIRKSRLFWVWALTLPLMAFNAYRNVDLLSTTMPSSAIAIIMSVAGLFALDLGVLLWIKLLDTADSEDQSHIAVILIVVDVAGVVVGVLADTWLQTDTGADRSVIAFIANWAIPIVIGANFIAGILYKMFDPHREVEMEQRRIEREIARERAQADLDYKRAEAEAAIALQRARADQIRQSHALDMLRQAQELTNPAQSIGRDGKKAGLTALNAEGAESPKARR